MAIPLGSRPRWRRLLAGRRRRQLWRQRWWLAYGRKFLIPGNGFIVMTRRFWLPVCAAMLCVFATWNAAWNAASAQGLGLNSVQWVLEDLQQRGVLDRVQSTISFNFHGRVSGRAGCNQFMGRASISSNVVQFGALATTRRACLPVVMDQERRYLAVLRRAQQWRLDQHGRLFLMDGQGRDLARFARQS
ncbi:MAG: META domain-containing protein [Rhizobiales bacterium]|nr:META domain-containing protein [Hyphomicrobiales bacterium]